ncbi:MAG: porin family protein [Gemmatimonadota bacterium]|nr:porin family protein [Gemmatimonadota bacterium]
MQRFVLSSFAAASFFGSSVLAQSAAPRVEVTPYAGYMLFGDFIDGPVGTSIGNAGGALIGAQLGVALTPNVAVVGNVARASGDINLGIPFLDGITVGSSSAWMFDGALQLALPLSGSALKPFVQVGAGAMRHSVKIGLSTEATNFVGTLGAGADVGLTRNIGLRLMAKDYIGRFDVREATTIDYEPDIAHNFGLSAGLKIAF